VILFSVIHKHGVIIREAPSREMAKPRSLRPAFDALDLVIGQSAQISTLRARLTMLREQADGVDHSP
jgi:hypothetical protein